jgi:hypothetical protein
VTDDSELRIVPANEASSADITAIFGTVMRIDVDDEGGR